MARVSSDHNPVLDLALARLRHPAKGRFPQAPNTYEGARMADKRIGDTFVASPDHVGVCAIFRYDTSDSKESKEDQHETIAVIYSVAEIYTLVDNEDNECPSKNDCFLMAAISHH